MSGATRDAVLTLGISRFLREARNGTGRVADKAGGVIPGRGARAVDTHRALARRSVSQHHSGLTTANISGRMGRDTDRRRPPNAGLVLIFVFTVILEKWRCGSFSAVHPASSLFLVFGCHIVFLTTFLYEKTLIPEQGQKAAAGSCKCRQDGIHAREHHSVGRSFGPSFGSVQSTCRGLTLDHGVCHRFRWRLA